MSKGKLRPTKDLADEIRAKGRKMVAWIGLAIDATSRLWLAGVVSMRRDRALADRFLHQVRACWEARVSAPRLHGRMGSVSQQHYACVPRKSQKTVGRGRCALEVWPDLCIATMIKRTEKKRVVEVTRKITLGTVEKAHKLLQMIV